MADGGVICCAGHLMTILAAKERSIPVVGVSGMHKLTPLYSHNQMNVLQTMSSPSDVLPYDSPIDTHQIEVLVPSYDYIPPDLIQLYITNNGSHQPSYIYRLLSEFFHPLDYNY
jgi:translation initiation factor eIF-2B subunit beta